MAKRKKSADKVEKKEKKVKKSTAPGKKSGKKRAPKNQKYRKDTRKDQPDPSKWSPVTELGKKVKNRELVDIDEILTNSLKILEPEIVDNLLSLEQDLLLIGQSKGKFGGGSRRVFRQTQKKTREGNKPKFSTIAIVGDKDGHVGIGFGKAKETVPAREKAIRNAKLNIFKIRRGCGSWQCGCRTSHSIPFTITGKCGSVEVKLMPAPKGKRLCCEKEIAKILGLAGVKDIWTKTRGQTKNKINFIYACEDALRKLVKTKVHPKHYESLAIVEGRLPEEQRQENKEEGEEKGEEKGKVKGSV